jgi:hypothetical protein
MPILSNFTADLYNTMIGKMEEEFDKGGVGDLECKDLGDWCEKNKVMLDGRPFSFHHHEYLREPYADTHNFQVEIKATQLGLTSKALLRVVYGCRYGMYRGIMYFFPSRTDVTEMSKGRLTPLIEDNPETIGQWVKDTDSANVKKIWNTFLYLRGMNSRVGMKCHDDQTEVLTRRRGWKFFKDTTMADEFATRSPLGRWSWVLPTALYQYDHEGSMYHFRNKRVDCLVTPNHRMLVIDGDGKERFEMAEDLLPGKGRFIAVSQQHIDFQVDIPAADIVSYRGRIYCATVPNGTLCTRRKGKAIWSGNSTPSDMNVYDELDEAPPKAVDMANERMGHSEIGDLLFLSNPTLPDYGIDALFQTTDQRFWLLKCPKCNHYTDLVGTFPRTIIRVHGKTIRACEKCQAELNPEKGLWVAKRPGILDRRGRQFSQLYSMSRNSSPENILRAFETTTNLTDFYNLKLGIAYVDAKDRLTEEQVLSCCGSTPMASESKEGTYMGVDQNNNFHVVLGKKTVRGGEIVHVGEYKGNADKTGESWKILDEFMGRFKVMRCVVDYLPETKHARAFAERFPGRVFLNFYNKHQKGSYNWNEATMMVQVNRTESLDASHQEIVDHTIVLPRQSDVMETFAKQCHNVAKKLVTDDETGSQYYEYMRLGPDHYRHAFNYEAMARQSAPELMFPELL